MRHTTDLAFTFFTNGGLFGFELLLSLTFLTTKFFNQKYFLHFSTLVVTKEVVKLLDGTLKFAYCLTFIEIYLDLGLIFGLLQ